MVSFKLSICSARNSRKYKLRRQKGTSVVSGEGEEVGGEGGFTEGHRGLGYACFYHVDWGDGFIGCCPPQSLYITVLSSLPHDVILFWKQSLQRLLVEMKWHWNKVGPESSMLGVLNQKSTTWTGKPCDGRETQSPSQGTQWPAV